MARLQNRENKIIVIGGPTASGKTSLAEIIVGNLNAEIINADSMQIYKGMDIGTNKELIDVPSWLFDIVDPGENFTLADYQKAAVEKISEIHAREKIPVIVGGTGLYIDAVIKGYSINGTPDFSIRQKLSKLSVQELQEELKAFEFDLGDLNNSDLHNPRRLIRLIEKSGNATFKKSSPDWDVIFLYPEFTREDLMRRIDVRVDEMLKNGLIKEVQSLIDSGVSKDTKSMQGMGYKEVTIFLDGEIANEAELAEKIKLAHKQYAKRQITWFEGEGRGYDLVCVTAENIMKKVNFALSE